MAIKWIDNGFFNVVESFNPETGNKNSTVNKCSIINVPNSILLETWETLVLELKDKNNTLTALKEKYDTQEFEIVFQSDIDFKKLYNSTSEKVRKQHAKKELKKLDEDMQALELRVNFLKSYIPLLKEVIRNQREVMGND